MSVVSDYSCYTDADDLTDTSFMISSDEELSGTDFDMCPDGTPPTDPEQTPVALDSRFVFDFPTEKKQHLSVRDAYQGRRRMSISKSFKRARKRVESLGAHDYSGTARRRSSAGRKIRNKMGNLRRNKQEKRKSEISQEKTPSEG